MSYSFEILPSAEDQLSDIWLSSSDRNAITSASAEIERWLRSDPFRATELLFDTVRRLVIGPRGADFEILENEREVLVLTFWNRSLGPSNPTGH